MERVRAIGTWLTDEMAVELDDALGELPENIKRWTSLFERAHDRIRHFDWKICDYDSDNQLKLELTLRPGAYTDSILRGMGTAQRALQGRPITLPSLMSSSEIGVVAMAMAELINQLLLSITETQDVSDRFCEEEAIAASLATLPVLKEIFGPDSNFGRKILITPRKIIDTDTQVFVKGASNMRYGPVTTAALAGMIKEVLLSLFVERV